MKKVSEVEKWLNEHSINNFVVSDDLNVTVYGNVNLNGKIRGDKLPVKFRKVDGYFDIGNNDLVTLEGCPNYVAKDFNCANNRLVSLLGGPKEVGEFNCANNKLSDLSHCPKEVDGSFDCSNNQLVSIQGVPKRIKGYFKCSNNKISSLKDGPKYIESYFDCSSNLLESLDGGPSSVGQDYVCNKNRLLTLDGISDEIGWDLITDIRLNHVDSSFMEESKSWRYKGNAVIAHIYKPVVLFTTKEEITRWLKQHDIKDFVLLKDNSVNVTGHVKLSGRLGNFLKLPLVFNEVSGDFDISDNELTSLEGSPVKVKGNFMAYKNEIASLKGSPKEVGKSFIVLQNNITSLEHSPLLVKEDFICSHNPLKSLEGINEVQGFVFTGIEISALHYQKYVYKGIATYKYQGETLTKYLETKYVSQTEEEKIFEKTKANMRKAITKLLDTNTLKKEMINDNLINNLNKYQLDDLLEKVLAIKYPLSQSKSKELSEEDILKMMFESEI